MNAQKAAEFIIEKLQTEGGEKAVLVRYRGEKEFARSDAATGMPLQQHCELIEEIAQILRERGIPFEFAPPKELGISAVINSGLKAPHADAIGWSVIKGGIDVSKMKREDV